MAQWNMPINISHLFTSHTSSMYVFYTSIQNIIKYTMSIYSFIIYRDRSKLWYNVALYYLLNSVWKVNVAYLICCCAVFFLFFFISDVNVSSTQFCTCLFEFELMLYTTNIIINLNERPFWKIHNSNPSLYYYHKVIVTVMLRSAYSVFFSAHSNLQNIHQIWETFSHFHCKL